jgi:hypothetical protein
MCTGNLPTKPGLVVGKLFNPRKPGVWVQRVNGLKL